MYIFIDNSTVQGTEVYAFLFRVKHCHILCYSIGFLQLKFLFLFQCFGFPGFSMTY